MFLLSLYKTMCCGYSLKVPVRDSSNESHKLCFFFFFFFFFFLMEKVENYQLFA